MPRFVEAHLSAVGCKFSIVVSRFNDFITARLLDGALDALLRHGASDNDITVYRVPGSFEIPLFTKKLIDSGQAGEAVICLGALIRGPRRISITLLPKRPKALPVQRLTAAYRWPLGC